MKFPIFIELAGKKIIVIGGGTIATRRINALLPFGAVITIISPVLSEKLEALCLNKQVKWTQKNYETGDLKDAFMVLACTDSRLINHLIYEDALKLDCYYNSCDCKEECDFYFPGLATKDNIVIGITANGVNHSQAREVTEEIRALLLKDGERR